MFTDVSVSDQILKFDAYTVAIEDEGKSGYATSLPPFKIAPKILIGLLLSIEDSLYVCGKERSGLFSRLCSCN